jgi:hypothetical protein
MAAGARSGGGWRKKLGVGVNLVPIWFLFFPKPPFQHSKLPGFPELTPAGLRDRHPVRMRKTAE